MNRPKNAGNLNRLQFLTSAVDLQGCPADSLPEIAIIGRSNAGKSTLINGVAGARIAMVSATPGKTRLLNFYSLPRYRWVDMPGYGFAQRGAEERDSWRDMIEPYLSSRGNLCGLLIVMDIRRSWSADEESLLHWLAPRELPAAVVLTKADKISSKAAQEKVEEIRRDSGLSGVLVTSSLKKAGYQEVEEYVFNHWVKPRLEGQ